MSPPEHRGAAKPEQLADAIAHRVNEIHILRDDITEGYLIDSGSFDIPDFDKGDEDTRRISLHLTPETERIAEVVGDRTFVTRETLEEEAIRAMGFWRNSRLAIGQYIFFCEQHRQAPDRTLASLREQSESLTTDYLEWRTSLDRNRRKSVMQRLVSEQLGVMGDDPVDPRIPQWRKAVAEGTWRSTTLSEPAAAHVEEAIKAVDFEDGRSCYLTTMHTYRELKDALDEDMEVEYCEGLAFPKHAGMPVEHAWIEVDGAVAEVTWPSHYPDLDGALYYGVSLPEPALRDRIQSRGPATTLLLDEAEYAQRMQYTSQIAAAAGMDLGTLMDGNHELVESLKADWKSW